MRIESIVCTSGTSCTLQWELASRVSLGLHILVHHPNHPSRSWVTYWVTHTHYCGLHSLLTQIHHMGGLHSLLFAAQLAAQGLQPPFLPWILGFWGSFGVCRHNHGISILIHHRIWNFYIFLPLRICNEFNQVGMRFTSALLRTRFPFCNEGSGTFWICFPPSKVSSLARILFGAHEIKFLPGPKSDRFWTNCIFSTKSLPNLKNG